MQVRYVCKTQKPVKAGFLLQSIAEGRAKSDSVADRLPVADLCGVSLATRRITEGLSPKADSRVQRLMYAGAVLGITSSLDVADYQISFTGSPTVPSLDSFNKSITSAFGENSAGSSYKSTDNEGFENFHQDLQKQT